MAKAALTYQKLRGGYYTPKPIANFLARWAIQSSRDEILEPSCGNGVVLGAGLETLIDRGASRLEASRLIHGVEIDRQEAAAALARIEVMCGYANPTIIKTDDFFSYCKAHLNDKRLFDVVIGNPPFIRYQNFLEEQRVPAFELMTKAGMRPSRLTNTWVPFLVASSFLLNSHGRLAMVIPAELLQVNYAAELRLFLSNYYNKLTLVTFRKLVFEGIQQEVVLLLAERNGGGQTGIRTIELDTIDDLASYQHTDFVKSELKPMDHSKEKWTQYFLNKSQIGLLRELEDHPKLIRIGDILDVDVGVVTGQNDFFVLDAKETKCLALQRYTKRIVSRSAHLKGLIFSERDWQKNADDNLPALLLDLPDVPFDKLTIKAQHYVTSGERRQLHTGFKCRIRKNWYKVPSVWIPDAFLLRQIHGYPKLILNQAQATSTDTIHRVKLRNGTNAREVAAAFLNSLTFAFSEVLGRSYGGGVLELEPNEAEQLPIPLRRADSLDIKELHALIIKDDVNSVLDITDHILLIKGLGLSKKDARSLRVIWQKLRDRRINRKHSRKKLAPLLALKSGSPSQLLLPD
ncbi:MAG: adenine-specific DNA-methyltransferase [Blastocatellia bacterium]|nr:adenine-specific DNA-methyltransferase [Blastocatellia bacterium]